MVAIAERAHDSTPPKVQPSFPSSKDIYGDGDPSFLQTVSMSLHSGVVLTEEQIRLYREERMKPLDENSPSDQVLMARVLEQTGGQVDFFRQAYQNIFPPPIK